MVQYSVYAHKFVAGEPTKPLMMPHREDMHHGQQNSPVSYKFYVGMPTLLRTCATAWARTAVNDDARELLELGRTLYERLGTVAGHLDALGGALRRSVTAYNKAVGSMEKRLLVTARTLETLGDQVSSPALISADAAQVRTFTASELTTDRKPESTTM